MKLTVTLLGTLTGVWLVVAIWIVLH